ncbi:TPA: cobalamin biosynthesis protein CbiM, partial [Clostridioides difficile]|nr:cobalamin biosynthesis protein CbiM [Clostridioides difficile]
MFVFRLWKIRSLTIELGFFILLNKSDMYYYVLIIRKGERDTKMKQNIKLGVIAALMLIILTPVTSNAMHIMEGYLPVKWSIAWGVIF